jgi:PAS domain S-box-containing protein
MERINEVITQQTKLDFSYLPNYAAFLLRNKFSEFAAAMLRISREEKLHILKYFETLSEEQIVKISHETCREILEHFEQNNAEGYILNSQKKWVENQLPHLLQTEHIISEDISTLSFVRRKLFRQFLMEYTSDFNLWFSIMEEVDRFTSAQEENSIRTLVNINQSKLREHHLQLEEVQEITGLGTFEWDLQGNNSVFSPQLMKLFELEKTGMLSDFLEFVHPADQELLKQAISGSMEQNGFYECQYRYKKKQPKVIWSRGIVVFENGKPSRMKGFVMDVTKNYLLNEMLIESEKTFRQLIQNAPDAVVVVDEKGKIVFWNPKAEAIFGWGSDEIIGNTLFNTILAEKHSEEKLNDMKWWKAYGQANVNKTIEVSAQNKKGKEFIIALSIATSTWNSKLGYIAFIRNITKEKKIEKELELHRNQLAQKNIELEKINTELTSFNYIASHDLKEPLRKIKTYSNFIIEKNSGSLTGEVKEYMKRIITATTNMQRLIDDLLAFSRTSSMEKNLSSTDLNELLEEVKGSLKYTIEEHSATIVSDTLPVAKVIPFQFQQLMENIIGNAIKYRKPETTPHVSITYRIASGYDYIPEGAIPSMEYGRISVKDNGIGFNQIYANKIFEIFQRLHGKNEYSGTGIGLAICKKIVENHGGFITAHGSEGEGATFNIFIPTRCPEAEKNIRKI